MALFTVAMVFVASWSLALQGRGDSARTRQSQVGANGPADSGTSSTPAPGGSDVATQLGRDDAITLRVSGTELTLEPAVVSPVVGRQAAIDTARARLEGGGMVIQSEPEAEHWLVTDPEQPGPQVPTYMLKRPMWVVTFDQVLSHPRGPANRSPTERTTFRAIAHVFIDSGTGKIITAKSRSLEPISPPDAEKDDCTKVAC